MKRTFLGSFSRSRAFFAFAQALLPEEDGALQECILIMRPQARALRRLLQAPFLPCRFSSNYIKCIWEYLTVLKGIFRHLPSNTRAKLFGKPGFPSAAAVFLKSHL